MESTGKAKWPTALKQIMVDFSLLLQSFFGAVAVCELNTWPWLWPRACLSQLTAGIMSSWDFNMLCASDAARWMN